ncbi:MAG: hypothetical protein U0228_32975 [Myxococcaceae bacterium]
MAVLNAHPEFTELEVRAHVREGERPRDADAHATSCVSWLIDRGIAARRLRAVVRPRCEGAPAAAVTFKVSLSDGDPCAVR